MSTAAVFAPPAIESPIAERTAFLRKVGVLTFLGVAVSSIVGTISAFGFALFPVLLSGWFPMIIAFGCFAIAHYGAQGIVMRSDTQAMKLAGFALGTVAQGVAMGMVLLVAALVSAETFGNPFAIIGQAFAIVGASALGMTGWLLTGPKNLSMVRGALAVLWLPMLAAMVLTWVFPIGGLLGIGVSAIFVLVSALGLVYQLNQVIHKVPSTAHVEGAYLITMSLLVMLWNVLTLLTRLQSRR